MSKVVESRKNQGAAAVVASSDSYEAMDKVAASERSSASR